MTVIGVVDRLVARRGAEGGGGTVYRAAKYFSGRGILNALRQLAIVVFHFLRREISSGRGPFPGPFGHGLGNVPFSAECGHPVLSEGTCTTRGNC